MNRLRSPQPSTRTHAGAAREPLILYWEILALTIFAVCIFAGWRSAQSRDERVRMLWTQALHWGASSAR